MKSQSGIELKWALGLLAEGKRKYFGLVFLNVSLGILDLIGVAIFGLVATIGLRGFQNTQLSPRTQMLLSWINLEDKPIKTVMISLILAGTSFLLLKTLASIIVTVKTQKFLSLKSADIASHVARQALGGDLLRLSRYDKQETRFYITHGPKAVMNGICASYSSLIADIVLLLLMFLVLLASSVQTSIASLTFFAISGLLLHLSQKKQAFEVGSKRADLGVISEKRLLMMFSSFKESFVQNQIVSQLNELEKEYRELAKLDARLSILPFYGKYFMELVLVLSTLLVFFIQSVLGDIADVVGSLSIFLVAGSRIAPAILRIQQSLLNIRANLGTSIGLRKILDLGLSEPEYSVVKSVPRKRQDSFKMESFSPNVVIDKVTFYYGKQGESSFHEVLDDVTLNINSGEKIAIVGESGAGKTTLVDLILGLQKPKNGSISVSGVSPVDAIKTWPGKIVYIPQEISIVEKDIRQNVALGIAPELIDDELVLESLSRARLQSLASRTEFGIYRKLTEGLGILSGGEKQRIGIARAFYSKADLIILDEATSALDGENESNISSEMFSINQKTTLIMIAHRLSSIQNADRIVFLKNRKVSAQGTFSELRAISKDFENQVKQMQLRH